MTQENCNCGCGQQPETTKLPIRSIGFPLHGISVDVDTSAIKPCKCEVATPEKSGLAPEGGRAGEVYVSGNSQYGFQPVAGEEEIRNGQAAAERDGAPALVDVQGLALKQGMRGLAVFSEPGTFTWQRPEGCRNVYVRICGGGGGSGGVPATGSGQFSSSAGGGGAGYAEKFITDVAEEVAVEVGQGGSAGALGSGNGGDGGESRFGDYVSATGGTGSSKGVVAPFGRVSALMSGGLPGKGQDGSLNLHGGYGLRTVVFSNNAAYTMATGGACAMFPSAVQSNGGLPVNPGNGAMGSYQLNENDRALEGWQGGNGCVMVYAF